MRNTILSFLAVLLGLHSYSQEVISSGGDTFSQGSVSMDFTLGELAIESLSSNAQMTQGFHQTLLNDTYVLELSDFDFKVFPNPTADVLQIQIDDPSLALNEVTITDMKGRLVDRFSGSNYASQNISLSHLTTGSYLLQLSVSGSNTPSQNILIQKF